MHYSVTFNHRWQCGIHRLRESFIRWVSTDTEWCMCIKLETHSKVNVQVCGLKPGLMRS